MNTSITIRASTASSAARALAEFKHSPDLRDRLRLYAIITEQGVPASINVNAAELEDLREALNRQHGYKSQTALAEINRVAASA